MKVIAAAFSSVLAAAALGLPISQHGKPVTASAPGFVARRGTQLYLDGSPWRFTGVDAYELATAWGINAGCGPMVTDAHMDDLFAWLRPRSAVRFWAFQGLATNSNGPVDLEAVAGGGGVGGSADLDATPDEHAADRTLSNGVRSRARCIAHRLAGSRHLGAQPGRFCRRRCQPHRCEHGHQRRNERSARPHPHTADTEFHSTAPPPVHRTDSELDAIQAKRWLWA